jgi:hypothetical protein
MLIPGNEFIQLYVSLTPSAQFQFAGHDDANHPFTTEKSRR